MIATTEQVSAAVQVLGIRHHGPGSARSVLAALDRFRPDQVLVEGPADADELLGWVSEALVPPVALLAYATDQPAVAAFWPFAVFSPEWQALRWAAEHQVPSGFCDLPAAVVLAGRSGRPTDLWVLDEDSDDADDTESADDGADRTGRTDGGADSVEEAAGTGRRPPGGTAAERARRRSIRRDPLRALAEAGGYDDPERWWEDVVENRHDESSPFPLVTEAMAELRSAVGPPQGNEARREAYMRGCVRAALRAGRQRVAVICGAWHAPALTLPLPPASRDVAVLRGSRKRKVGLTWVPWTHDRLATASGYGAGITSPGWYHHLWTAPDRPVARWMTAVAHSLRARDRSVSSAHVIEAVRLAETLAALRNRPLAGLTEVTDAVRAVVCDGDETAVRYVHADLVVGQRLGRVSPDVPTVPLEADLTATCRSLRLKREASAVRHDLDLRRSIDRRRSTLFHRMRLLGVDWARTVDSEVASRGTFRETWQTRWRPEHALAVVEAGTWGTTVAAAAGARTVHAAEGGTLLEIAAAVGNCLSADLPEALTALLSALADRAAVDTDLAHLMRALPELAQAGRYGNVRAVDREAVTTVSEALLARVCVGLPRAVSGAGDEAALDLRNLIDGVHLAVALLDPTGSRGWRGRWLDALARVLDDSALPAVLAGRFTRILLDAGRLADRDRRVSLALSHGTPAAAKAAWVDGFFADGALLLIHDPVLREVVDRWVAGLDDEEFVAVLPVVRRTFATFSPAERRLLAERLHGFGGASRSPSGPVPDMGADDLIAAALTTVEAILRGPR